MRTLIHVSSRWNVDLLNDCLGHLAIYPLIIPIDLRSISMLSGLDGGLEKKLCHVLHERTLYTSSAGVIDDILFIVAN
jgi:hypothetical protein